MSKHEFLSEEWIAAAQAIRESYAGKATTSPPPMKMNVVITEVPFGAGSMDAHIDTTDGEMSLDMGHLEGEDLTVTVDYATAKAIFIQEQSRDLAAYEKSKAVETARIQQEAAIAFGKAARTIGFDINSKRVEALRQGHDHTGEVTPEDLTQSDIVFTSELEALREADFHIVAVPTPVEDAHHHDLTPLLRASETLWLVLKRGDFVVRVLAKVQARDAHAGRGKRIGWAASRQIGGGNRDIVPPVQVVRPAHVPGKRVEGRLDEVPRGPTL